jgi:hypothetical protein
MKSNNTIKSKDKESDDNSYHHQTNFVLSQKLLTCSAGRWEKDGDWAS